MHFKNFQSLNNKQLNNSQNHGSNNNHGNNNNNQYTFQGHLRQNNQKAFSANVQNSSFMSQNTQKVSRNLDYSCVHDQSISGINKSFTQSSRFLATPNKPSENLQFARMFENRETKNYNEFSGAPTSLKACSFQNKVAYEEEDTRAEIHVPQIKYDQPADIDSQRFQEQIHEIVTEKIEQYCSQYIQEILTRQSFETSYDDQIKAFQEQIQQGQKDLLKISKKIDNHQEVYLRVKKDLNSESKPENHFEAVHKHLICQKTLLRTFSGQQDTIAQSVQDVNYKWDQLQVQINLLVNNNNILHSQGAMHIKEEINKIHQKVTVKKRTKK